jgi:hypothetical protein
MHAQNSGKLPREVAFSCRGRAPTPLPIADIARATNKRREAFLARDASVSCARRRGGE